VEVYRIYHC